MRLPLFALLLPVSAAFAADALEPAWLATRVELLDNGGRFLHAVTSKAGTSDRNDMPALDLQPATAYQLRVVRDDRSRDFAVPAKEAGDHTLDLTWSQGKPVEDSPGLRSLRQWLCQATAAPLAAIPPASLTKTEAISTTSSTA